MARFLTLLNFIALGEMVYKKSVNYKCVARSPAGSPQQAQRTHPGEDTPLQRSSRLLSRRYLQRERSILSTTRGCCECAASFLSLVTLTFGLWFWHSNSSERRTKHAFRENFAQIRSAIPDNHCRMPVSRIERVSTILRIWRINGRQTITVNCRVSGPKFTTFLYDDVDRTSALLTRPSVFPSCHPLWNASPKKEGLSPISADFAPKIGCYSNVPWPIGKPIPDWTSTPVCLPPSKMWWRSVL